MNTLSGVLRVGLSCIGLVLCLFSAGVGAETDADTEIDKLHKQYADQFWSYLETSQYEQLRVSSAIRLLRSEDLSLTGRGMRLIKEVMDQATIDPVTLWLIAEDCRWRKSADWCESGEAYDRLRKADPNNAAVLILEFSHEKQVDDESLIAEEARLQLLEAVASARRYDIYWGRSTDKVFEEALKFIEKHPIPPTPRDYPVDIPPYAYAFMLASMYWITAPTASYNEISELCREQSWQKDSEGMALCERIARMMQDNGLTVLSKTVGFGIEKAILEAVDADESLILTLETRKEAYGVISRCFSQLWVNHVDSWAETSQDQMMDFLKNQDELGEWDGYGLALLQEYEASPENLVVDPAECLSLLEMNDESLTKFMDGRSAAEVWEQMQADAKAKSQK